MAAEIFRLVDAIAGFPALKKKRKNSDFVVSAWVNKVERPRGPQRDLWLQSAVSAITSNNFIIFLQFICMLYISIHTFQINTEKIWFGSLN